MGNIHEMLVWLIWVSVTALLTRFLGESDQMLIQIHPLTYVLAVVIGNVVGVWRSVVVLLNSTNSVALRLLGAVVMISLIGSTIWHLQLLAVFLRSL